MRWWCGKKRISKRRQTAIYKLRQKFGWQYFIDSMFSAREMRYVVTKLEIMYVFMLILLTRRIISLSRWNSKPRLLEHGINSVIGFVCTHLLTYRIQTHTHHIILHVQSFNRPAEYHPVTSSDWWLECLYLSAWTAFQLVQMLNVNIWLGLLFSTNERKKPTLNHHKHS
jgi:hypothetical protein